MEDPAQRVEARAAGLLLVSLASRDLGLVILFWAGLEGEPKRN